MEKDVHTVDCETTVKDTAAVMTKEGHGCVIVVRSGIAVGIVTERDIVHKITADAIDPSKIRVEDIMTSPLVTISAKARIHEAAAKMSVHEIRRIVVIDNRGRMMGLLSTGDLARWLAKQKDYLDSTLNAIARLKVSSPYA